MRLADQLLDRDAELSTVKSQIEAMHVEQAFSLKLDNLQKQLELEVGKREAAEHDKKVSAEDFERQKLISALEAQRLQEQLRMMKEENSTVDQSFTEYKLRAQRILQDKDKLLQDVKQQQSDRGVQPAEFLSAEFDQLQQERDLLRVEISQTNSQLQNMRDELTTATQKSVVSPLSEAVPTCD